MFQRALGVDPGTDPHFQSLQDPDKTWLVVSLGTLCVLLTIMWQFTLRSYQRRNPTKEAVLQKEKPVEVGQTLVLRLPEEVLGSIMSFAGACALGHITRTCKACYSSVWSSPITWSSIVLSLGFVPIEGADVRSLQSKVRRTLYGIDHLCQASLCKQGRIIVRGDQCTLLCGAMRACSGLSFEDGVEIADQVVSRCLELLVSFNVDDTEARHHAKQLTSTVSTRTDVFCPEQCNKVETAFSDAMDLHQLLSDVMLAPAESEMALDDALAAPFDADVWGDEPLPTFSPTSDLEVQGDSGCRPDVDAALDRLISVLRDIVDEGEEQPVTA